MKLNCIVLVVLLSACSGKNDDSINFNVKDKSFNNINETTNSKQKKEINTFFYRINAFGNRFILDESVIQKNIPSILEELRSKGVLFKEISENFPNDLYIFKKTAMNNELNSCIVGYGWNDLGLTDLVNFKVFLLVQNKKNEIIDFLEIAKATNFNKKLEYSEFVMKENNVFSVINYDFLLSDTLLTGLVLELLLLSGL